MLCAVTVPSWRLGTGIALAWSGKALMLSMTGVGAYPAQEHRLHSVATCVFAHLLYEKSAMVSVTRNRTMEQAMRVENEACASRLCSADMQEAIAAFFEKRQPNCSRCVLERCVAPGPMSTLQLRGIQCTRWTLCFP